MYNHNYSNLDYISDKFIGRLEELAWLEEKYSQDKGQLIVVYGRRRIGKTETLREFSKNKDAIYYTCTESSDRLQLESFSRRILAKNTAAAKYLNSFSSWEQAFESLSDIAETESDKRTVLIIYEFPYMVKGCREIPSIIQKLWD